MNNNSIDLARLALYLQYIRVRGQALRKATQHTGYRMGFFNRDNTHGLPVVKIKPIAKLMFNGTVYYTLDNKGGYLISSKDKMAVMKHTKGLGFTIDTRAMRRTA